MGRQTEFLRFSQEGFSFDNVAASGMARGNLGVVILEEKSPKGFDRARPSIRAYGKDCYVDLRVETSMSGEISHALCASCQKLHLSKSLSSAPPVLPYVYS